VPFDIDLSHLNNEKQNKWKGTTMSMESMAEFIEKANNDEVLANELVGILEDNEEEVIFSKIVALTKANGFDVTLEDVKEIQQQFINMPNSDGELNDEELEGVAGGVASVVAAALITGGAGVTAAGIGAGGAVTAAVIKNGVNKTASDIGSFMKKW
jgi:predicted ribosomally synthesized peptide with nif11-like leader